MKQFFETYCDKPQLGTLHFRISDKTNQQGTFTKELEGLTEMVDEDKNSQ